MDPFVRRDGTRKHVTNHPLPFIRIYHLIFESTLLSASSLELAGERARKRMVRSMDGLARREPNEEEQHLDRPTIQVLNDELENIIHFFMIFVSLKKKRASQYKHRYGTGIKHISM